MKRPARTDVERRRLDRAKAIIAVRRPKRVDTYFTLEEVRAMIAEAKGNSGK